MLNAYIRAAMARATHRRLAASGHHFLEIPQLPGVWAAAETLEAGRTELREVLEDWIAVGLSQHQTNPAIDGIDLKHGCTTVIGG